MSPTPRTKKTTSRTKTLRTTTSSIFSTAPFSHHQNIQDNTTQDDDDPAPPVQKTNFSIQYHLSRKIYYFHNEEALQEEVKETLYTWAYEWQILMIEAARKFYSGKSHPTERLDAAICRTLSRVEDYPAIQSRFHQAILQCAIHYDAVGFPQTTEASKAEWAAVELAFDAHLFSRCTLPGYLYPRFHVTRVIDLTGKQ